MEQIIENSEDVVQGDITLSKLKTLEFGNLHSLMNFYSGNYIFNFPLLEKISVYNCPSLMFFASGAFIMPMLQKLEKNGESHNCEHHELNGLIGESNKVCMSLSFCNHMFEDMNVSLKNCVCC